MERLLVYLTRRKAVGIFLAVTGGLMYAEAWLDGWERLRNATSWDWRRLEPLVDNPVTPLLFVVAGVAWVLFVGPSRPDRRAKGVLVHGVRWHSRARNVITDGELTPYPHCPKHDVPLLWEAYDKTKASWQRNEISSGTWFGKDYNGLLYCPSGDGHEIHAARPWEAQQASQEAGLLLEAQRASRSAI